MLLFAIEKWLSIFFPKFEPYLTSARNMLLNNIWFLYIVLVLKEFGIFAGIRFTVEEDRATTTLGYIHGVSSTEIGSFYSLN